MLLAVRQKQFLLEGWVFVDRDKIKFFLLVPLAGASLVLMSLTNQGVNFTVETVIIAGIVCGMGIIAALLIWKRADILFLRNIREKPKSVTDEATRRLCGFKRFVAYNDYVIFESPNGKLTGHAYIQLDSLPYGIEQMSKDTQFNILSSFSRLLGTFNHPFTYMPICRPLKRKKYMNDIQKNIHNIRIANSVANVPDPKQEIEEKRMMEILGRLAEGENPMEIIWIVQIRESKNTVPEIKSKLDSHVESMIDSLSVIHSVSARRLSHADMVDAISNYFVLE